MVNNKFKRLQCPDEFLPTGIITSKKRDSNESANVYYAVHNISATNMIISTERQALISLKSTLPLRGTLKLPFVGTVSVKFNPEIIDACVVGGSVGNEERLVMEVSFVQTDYILTKSLEKYFVNVSENVNELELKSAGFETKGALTQCVFNRTKESITVMNKDKLIANIKISYNDDSLRVHYIKMEKGFDTHELIMEITAYFIKVAMKTKKRHVALPSSPDTPLGWIDIYSSALGRTVTFKSWKKLFAPWTDYILSEEFIKPTTRDKIRLGIYQAILTIK